MGTSDTDRLLERFTVDAWSRGDVSGFDETIAADYVLEPGMTADDFKEIVRSHREAFPDLTLTVLETVTEEDRIAYRWEMTGTHQGEFQGIAPTGRRVTASGMTMLQLRNGKVVHDRFESSSPPFEQQLTAEG
jgi:predicted ester cyclase